MKKASPSAGVICKDFDPVRIAKEYEAAGASCLSVLTDEKFFQGSLDYLRQIRAAVKLPLLRKDFIIDERQILEAIEWGADAILLIVAILTDEQLAKFHSLAVEAGLAVLVEVHDEEELERALKISPALIGVNNRDLKTFKVDLATTERLAAKFFIVTRHSSLVTSGRRKRHSHARGRGAIAEMRRGRNSGRRIAGEAGRHRRESARIDWREIGSGEDASCAGEIPELAHVANVASLARIISCSAPTASPAGSPQSCCRDWRCLFRRCRKPCRGRARCG